jgi:hypothetical protein
MDSVLATLTVGMRTIQTRAEEGSLVVDESIVPVLSAFGNATVLLEEAAEQVAAATGDPTRRDAIFSYKSSLQVERENLEDVVAAVRQQSQPQSTLQMRSLAAMQRVVDLTTSLVAMDEDTDLQRVQESCRVVGGHARDLLFACRDTSCPQEAVLESARAFSGSAVALVQLADALSGKYEKMDLARSDRLRAASRAVRELSVQMVAAVRGCRAAPAGNPAALAVLNDVTLRTARCLASIASGGEDLEKHTKTAEAAASAAAKQTALPTPVALGPPPTGPAPVPADASFSRSRPSAAAASPGVRLGSRDRKRTITNKEQGLELLRRARASTVADDIEVQLVRSLPSSPAPAAAPAPEPVVPTSPLLVPVASSAELDALRTRVSVLEAELAALTQSHSTEMAALEHSLAQAQASGDALRLVIAQIRSLVL